VRPAAPLTGAEELHVGRLRNCVRRTDDSVWCWGNGVGHYAAPLQINGAPAVDVAQVETCDSSDSPRLLMQDGTIQRGTVSINPDCGP
jgi:hypothetical protein